MSEEKVNVDVQDEPEVAVEFEGVSKSPEEATEAEDQGNAAERDIEKELADAQKETADLRDRMLRAAAENENFKKRVERERLASLKYAGETIFRDFSCQTRAEGRQNRSLLF